MIEEERDKALEDLFRNRLEESEITPGSDLTNHFMRRLGGREFLRFNASRFNIFYLVSLAAAGAVVAGMLLFPPAPVNEIPASGAKSDTLNQAGTGPDLMEVIAPVPEKEVKATYPPEPVKHGENIKTEPVVVRQVPFDRQDIIRMTGNDSAADSVMLTRNHIKDTFASGPGPLRAVIESSSLTGCVPLRVTFSSSASGVCSANWSFGDGGSSDKPEVDYIYDIPGTYNVVLTVLDDKGHMAVSAARVEVWPRPRASFEIHQPEGGPVEGSVRFVNNSTGAVQYLWDLGDGVSSGAFEVSHKYERYGDYDVMLIAFSEHGCADSLTITDAFTDSGLYLKFPNAFTPNTGGPTGGYYTARSDGANQVFHPVSSGVTSYNLKIFSKQGVLVFESSDLNLGWDGYYKGQLCSPGVYVWKVRGSFRNGEPIVMSGDVTLLNY